MPHLSIDRLWKREVCTFYLVLGGLSIFMCNISTSRSRDLKLSLWDVCSRSVSISIAGVVPLHVSDYGVNGPWDSARVCHSDLMTSPSICDEEGADPFHILFSIDIFRESFLWIMNENSALLSHIESSDRERQKKNDLWFSTFDITVLSFIVNSKKGKE